MPPFLHAEIEVHSSAKFPARNIAKSLFFVGERNQRRTEAPGDLLEALDALRIV